VGKKEYQVKSKPGGHTTGVKYANKGINPRCFIREIRKVGKNRNWAPDTMEDPPKGRKCIKEILGWSSWRWAESTVYPLGKTQRT